jgi:hypothetical protein
MKERRMPGIIENTVAARVLPLKSTLLSLTGPIETATVKSEFLDDDVRSLVGEVYAG